MNQTVELDFVPVLNRALKTATIGQIIKEVAEPVTYMTVDKSLSIKIPAYKVASSNEAGEVLLDAVQLNASLVVHTIQNSGSFKDYMNTLKRQNPLLQSVNDYAAGRLVINSIGEAFTSHLIPAFTKKDHIIQVELFPDEDKNQTISWDEVNYGKSLNLTMSLLTMENLAPLMSKMDIFSAFGGDSNEKNSGHMKLL